MGIGDEIIASGHAYRKYLETGKKSRVFVLDFANRPRWSDMWNGLDWIASPKEPREFDSPAVRNGPRCRPYIEYPWNLKIPCKYSGWKCSEHVGSIAFTQRELDIGRHVRSMVGPFVFMESNIAPTSNQNKQWGISRWKRLVEICKDVTFVQTGPAGTYFIDAPNVKYIRTENFRDAAAILAKSDDAILPEGAFHHAAAALGKSAVVLFGGAVDVDAMGYPTHRNIVRGPACGNWQPCDHCAKIWPTIVPEYVADVLQNPA